MAQAMLTTNNTRGSQVYIQHIIKETLIYQHWNEKPKSTVSVWYTNAECQH